MWDCQRPHHISHCFLCVHPRISCAGFLSCCFLINNIYLFTKSCRGWRRRNSLLMYTRAGSNYPYDYCRFLLNGIVDDGKGKLGHSLIASSTTFLPMSRKTTERGRDLRRSCAVDASFVQSLVKSFVLFLYVDHVVCFLSWPCNWPTLLTDNKSLTLF